MQTDGLLDSWTSGSDPCDNGWRGVSCDCNAAVGFSECTAPASPQRVLQLDVEGTIRQPRQIGGAALEGTVSPTLAKLTQLRRWAMPHNRLMVRLFYALGEQ